MADTVGTALPAPPRRARPVGSRWRPYASVLNSRIRAQRSYRLSFAGEMLAATLLGLVEFAEVWLIFRQAKVLGGLDMDAALLLFGLSNLAFASAQLVCGHLDKLPSLIRLGMLDIYHLRPQPVLLQLITSDFSLRRLARAGVALVVLAVGAVRNDIDWSVGTVVLLLLTVVSGAVLFAGLFVVAAGCQFFLIDGAEMTNSFTYGGAFAATQPASVFPAPLRILFCVAIPVAFTAYFPTLAVLGLPGPEGLPSWLAWCVPLAAAWAWLLAAVMWRLGTRRYQSGGG